MVFTSYETDLIPSADHAKMCDRQSSFLMSDNPLQIYEKPMKNPPAPSPREKSYVIIPSLTLVNPKSRSKAFIYQAGATFQFRSDMCYILSCGSWFDFFGAFYYIPHLRFGNEFDIGMKAKMGM